MVRSGRAGACRRDQKRLLLRARSSNVWGMRRILVCIVAMGALFGCSLPEGDPASPDGAYYGWLEVRAEADVAGMWGLLDPAARAEFERWSLVEKLMLNEIRTAYPREDVAAALAAIDGGARGELRDGKALFGKYLTPEPPARPGGLGAFGARVKGVELSEDGKRASITTYGGDAIELTADDAGRWYLRLPDSEWERLRNARAQAERNLERIRSNLRKLGGSGR